MWWLVLVAIMATSSVIGYVLYQIFKPRVTSGIVVRKVYEKEETRTRAASLRRSGMVAYFPYTDIDDEDFVLVLENEDGKRGGLEVSQKDWESINIGDHYQAKEEDRIRDMETIKGGADANIVSR